MIYDLSLPVKGRECDQDWHQLCYPNKPGFGAGSVDIYEKWEKVLKQKSLCETILIQTRMLSLLTYCTHSTARPFCMYSVMHLINWSFSSSNWIPKNTPEKLWLKRKTWFTWWRRKSGSTDLSIYVHYCWNQSKRLKRSVVTAKKTQTYPLYRFLVNLCSSS